MIYLPPPHHTPKTQDHIVIETHTCTDTDFGVSKPSHVREGRSDRHTTHCTPAQPSHTRRPLHKYSPAPPPVCPLCSPARALSPLLLLMDVRPTARAFHSSTLTCGRPFLRRSHFSVPQEGQWGGARKIGGPHRAPLTARRLSPHAASHRWPPLIAGRLTSLAKASLAKASLAKGAHRLGLEAGRLADEAVKER